MDKEILRKMNKEDLAKFVDTLSRKLLNLDENTNIDDLRQPVNIIIKGRSAAWLKIQLKDIPHEIHDKFFNDIFELGIIDFGKFLANDMSNNKIKKPDTGA